MSGKVGKLLIKLESEATAHFCQFVLLLDVLNVDHIIALHHHVVSVE